MQIHIYKKSYKPKTTVSGRTTPKILSIGVTLALSGCMGIYEGGFECPPGKGVGCKSISEVNHMINVRELPNNSFTISLPSEDENCEACPSRPLLQRETTEPQIWFAPSHRTSHEKALPHAYGQENKSRSPFVKNKSDSVRERV